MDVEKLINDYASWLKSEITFDKIGEYYEITTPYLDNANDYLQIYVKQDGDDLFFTDDSATLHGLKMNGFQLTPAHKNHLKKILCQYGVKLDGDELVAKASVNNFAEKEIYFSENVQFTGISGFSHNYDFLLQRSKTKPERLCHAVNNPSKSSMGNILFAWNDTKPARKNESQLIVILNDQKSIAKGVGDAFLNYEAKVVRWSERNTQSNIALFSAS